MLELLLEAGLWAVEALVAVALSPTGSTPEATEATLGRSADPGPRVFDDKTWSVEGGRMRRWSRRRERRGDVIHMLEFRSHPGSILSFREGSLPAVVTERIRRLQRRHEGRLFIESDGVTLVVRSCGPKPVTGEDAFRKECQGLLRELRGAAVPGRLVTGAGSCPVCKEPASPERSCGSCRTPHHRECWRYAGRCSVYGCAGRDLL